ncbi:hypothetical protein COCSUDRAFT_48161 [Coccomyxa subellipsoidea C-169]|uniref:F-box domain-containing protein n=1 Tax=Coccomyxa subellipsoidea (strain C-169) TaxID=574566 RepID=I0YT30_COCSC|nr:hypothetical protein COCSUDRAFT_48161 [Coccomyxa subellipsoidea C-169]EIE21549.1 hypothetical protein COCSUDRAFT_48161 [Coccomyxa subellipsoidea C-169]|eukprot:XP_005646093.1 hypothetical protein COCSUDRAFT_48161 [Coccomyxa subellipsoidea C-169]
MEFSSGKYQDGCDVAKLSISQPDWDCLPADALACVGARLKPPALASARLVSKSWRLGISLGVTKLQPKLQSIVGGRGSLYLSRMRWDEMKHLLTVFSGCQELNLVAEKVTANCALHFEAAHRLARIKIRSDCFEPASCRSGFQEMQIFLEILQARAPKITVDLDVHIDGDEFKSSYDSSLQPLVKLPPNVKVTALELIYITQATRKILDVATFKHLTALDIRLSGDGFIDDSTFALVGQLTLLEELSLHWLSRVSEEGLNEGLSSLARLTSLKLIDVTKVTDRVVQSLQKAWLNLGSLSLSNCYLLTDTSLGVFESLPSIYNLFLSGNGQFSSKAMTKVKRNVKLTIFRQCGINWASSIQLPAA